MIFTPWTFTGNRCIVAGLREQAEGAGVEFVEAIELETLRYRIKSLEMVEVRVITKKAGG